MVGDLNYPSTEEIHLIHTDIVSESKETEPGVIKPEAVESALTYISEGYLGQRPETIHEKAAHLMRLLVADHPYVDGNKRTALAATESLYGTNGYLFDYDDAEIRSWLRDLATDAESVDMGALAAYCSDHAHPTEE